MTLDCLACGKKLTPAVTLTDEDAREVAAPYGGTVFTSHGNYGSTVFDPSDAREFMEINVCDSCLLAAAQEGRVAYGRASVQVTYETLDLDNLKS